MKNVEDTGNLEDLCRALLDEIAAETVPPRIAELARQLAERLEALQRTETG